MSTIFTHLLKISLQILYSYCNWCFGNDMAIQINFCIIFTSVWPNFSVFLLPVCVICDTGSEKVNVIYLTNIPGKLNYNNSYMLFHSCGICVSIYIDTNELALYFMMFSFFNCTLFVRHLSNRQPHCKDRRLWSGNSQSTMEWLTSVPAANWLYIVDGNTAHLLIINVGIAGFGSLSWEYVNICNSTWSTLFSQ